LIFQQFLTDQR